MVQSACGTGHGARCFGKQVCNKFHALCTMLLKINFFVILNEAKDLR